MVDAVADFQPKSAAVIVLFGAQANKLGPVGPAVAFGVFVMRIVGSVLGMFVVLVLASCMFMMADAAVLQEPDQAPGAEQERAGNGRRGDISADLRGLIAAEGVIQRGADSALGAIRPKGIAQPAEQEQQHERR